MKNKRQFPNSDWEPCKPGELSKLKRNQSVSRRDAISKISSGIITIAAVGTAGAVFWNTQDTDSPGSGPIQAPRVGATGASTDVTPVQTERIPRISCREVVYLLPEYLCKDIKNEKLVARIENHLGCCLYCCEKRDAMLY